LNHSGEALVAPTIHLAIAGLGVLALGIIAYIVTGRRSLSGSLLVASVSAGCGAFLALRVFAVAQVTDWMWLVWALIGALIGLVSYYLFRSKR
jgi:ribose/xylose/arabinose/galactoside ABC-type transport system permease subunit